MWIIFYLRTRFNKSQIKFFQPFFIIPSSQFLQDIPTIKVIRCAPKDPPALTEEDQTTLKIYPFFLIASAIFVFITLLIYALLPELRDIHGVSIMCYLGSLGATFIILAIIMLAEIHKGVFCTCIGTKKFISLKKPYRNHLFLISFY